MVLDGISYNKDDYHLILLFLLDVDELAFYRKEALSLLFIHLYIYIKDSSWGYNPLLSFILLFILSKLSPESLQVSSCVLLKGPCYIFPFLYKKLFWALYFAVLASNSSIF